MIISSEVVAAVGAENILKGHGRERRAEMKRGFMVRARCPKCGGSVFLDNDRDIWFEQCLQCGHTHYLDNNIERTTKNNIRVTTEMASSVPG